MSKQKATWRQMAKVWQKLKPPSSPCPAQLKIWEKVIVQKIKKNPHLKVLILGPTPALRDLTLKYGLESIVVDINPMVLKVVSRLMKAKDRSKEKIVVADWLKMNFPHDYFDLILGDAVLNQILNKTDLESLLFKLKGLLKKDGRLLIREIVRLNPQPIIKGEKEWLRWFQKLESKKISILDLHSMLKYQSDVIPFKRSPSLFDNLPIYKQTLALYKQGKIGKKFLDWYLEIYGDDSTHKFLAVFLKKDLERLLKKYFKLLPLKQCRQYCHCQFMPSYLLMKER